MPERRRKLATVLAIAAAVGGLGTHAHSASSAQDFGQIERGRYLTVIADCGACHTDPVQDRPFAGGRPIETPFGMVVAPNITPDRDTGIGGLSDAQFEAVVREGKMPDGKNVYPAMPYPYYTRMSRADVLAIRAYLNTVAPVHHEVVSDQLPFPFNIRASLALWNALYFTPGQFKPDPAQSPAWNRGAYLVEGPGHCGACHTPKSKLGGDDHERALRGYSLQGWFAPDLTQDAHRGLGRWSANDLVEYLKKGHNQFAAASGPMAEEVADSSSRMSDADLAAIAAYLKSQPGATPGRSPLPAADPVMAAGAAIYDDLCSACHRPDGTGVPYLIPNLAASASVASSEPTTLIRVVLEGADSVSTREEPTAPSMPAFGWQLSDVQVAAVTTYIRNSWDHAAPAVSAGAVREARKQLSAD
jgi:mono/diheme cytochrome c family protein